MLARDSILNKALSLAFAAILAISLVPSSAFASAEAEAGTTVSGQDELAVNSGSAQDEGASAGEQKPAASETSGESEGAGDFSGIDQSAETNDSAVSEGDSAESDAVDDADATEGEGALEGELAAGLAAASQQDSAEGEQGDESSEVSVEEAVAYGVQMFSAAAASAVYDSENPNKVVEYGKYEPGTYTVTANLFVPASLNRFNPSIQAYVTNPVNPLSLVEDNGISAAEASGVPLTHMENNATLEVCEDDTLLLTIPVRNPVFTVQGIGSGEGIEVQDISTRAGEYGPVGPNNVVTKVRYTSRINQVTFKITKGSSVTVDGSNGYRIMGCTGYPTILDTVWTDQEFDLTVDFTNVPLKDVYVSDPVAPELTYNGERQGVSYDVDRCVVVEGTPAAVNAGDYSVTLKPRDGCQWSDGTTDERTVEWSIQKAQVTKKYEVVIQWDGEGKPTCPTVEEVNAGFKWYDADGNEIEPLEGVETKTFTGWDINYMYDYVSWLPSSLGLWEYMAGSGQGGCDKVRATYSGSDASTDNYKVSTEAIVHLTMAPSQMPKSVTCTYNGQSQIGLVHNDGAPFTGKLTYDSQMGSTVITPWNDFTGGWFAGLQSQSFVDVGTYSATLSPMETYGYADGYWYDTCTQEPRDFTWEIVPATLTATAQDIYIHEGGVPTLELTVTGFVEGESEGNAEGYVAPVAVLANGVDASTLKAGETCAIIPQGGEAKNYDFECVEGTLHVLPADTAAVPRVIEGLEYTGCAQQGVTKGVGYVLDGAFAKDAGTYVATATLEDGCTKWADGSTEKTRTFEYSIAKAVVTASYQSEIACYDTSAGEFIDEPMFRIVYSGFVNGERPENGTVDDWCAPQLYTLKNGGASDTSVSEWEYSGVRNPSFIPAYGSARNYDFAYARGILWVNDSSSSQTGFPLVSTGLVYNGSEQQGVFVRTGSAALNQVSAVNAGVYETRVVLDADATHWYPTTNYWYGENDCPGSDDRVITVQWSIAQVPLHAKASDVVVTAGDAPVLECEVEGFVNGESAQSASGYVAPVASLSAGVTADALEPGKTYPITVSGGSADNYYFASYEGGTLTVLPKGEAADPVVAAGLVYNGTEQRGVQENDAWTLSGDVTAVDAGDYQTVVTLNEGYVWADGTQGAKICEWSIAKATLTATYEGETVVKGQEPKLEVNVVGFCGSDTADTAKGYKAPWISLGALSADNLEVGCEYDLIPAGGEAANYDFVYVGGRLSVSALTPGTYTITANLMMPREYNPILSGVDVYANSPNNPFADYAGNAPVLDGNASAEEKIPSDPETMNATLIVGEDGTKTLLLPIKNPVFTTQSLGTCSALGEVKVERVAPADPSKWTYGSYATRIDKVLAQLTDNLSSGTAVYVFTGSELYAVPLDLTIKPDGDTALQLEIDYSSAQRVSSSTTVPELNPDPAEDPSDDGNEPGGSDKPTNPSGGNNGNGNSGNNNGTNSGGSSSAGNTGSTGSATQTVSYLKEGTYTVTSNIWVSRESSGLPLSPHLTSSIFPPKDPASSNATLQVDASGRALLTIPIVIQDKVMTVQSIAISGYSIVASTSSGGSLTSITVDLGVLENPAAVITRSATVSITMGSLASAISGLSGAQTWAAVFEVNLTGVPVTSGTTLSGTSTASGQGTIPESALAILSGDGESVEAEADAAAEAALAAAEDKASVLSSRASGGSEAGSQDEEAAGVPAAAIALGVVCVLAVAGAAIYVVARRRKKQQDAA